MSTQDRKRLLITGAGGTIGAALRRNLGMDYDYTFLVHRQAHVHGPNFKVIDLLGDYELASYRLYMFDLAVVLLLRCF
jgi:dTDP-4-dehydrorhamnose reductase